MSTTENKKQAPQWQPKILAFLCNWCSYAGADLAGVSRIQYPPNVRVIRVPCSGRVNPMFILRALQQGLDGVALKQMLDFTGLEDGRVQFSWVSAAEGQKFADIITEVTESVRKLGPAKRMVKQLWQPPAELLDELEAQAQEQTPQCPCHGKSCQ